MMKLYGRRKDGSECPVDIMLGPSGDGWNPVRWMRRTRHNANQEDAGCFNAGI
jgi:hypothetical protein